MRFFLCIFVAFTFSAYPSNIKLVSESNSTLETQLLEAENLGPTEIQLITIECDAERLNKIESSLNKDQSVTTNYDFSLFVFFKNNKIDRLEIPDGKFYGNGIDGSPLLISLKTCIINRVSKEFLLGTIEKGIGLIRIKFPVWVVPKNKKQ